jgi:hypothetical protein
MGATGKKEGVLYVPSIMDKSYLDNTRLKQLDKPLYHMLSTEKYA